MNNKPEIGTIVTFNSSFGSETGKVVGYATLDPDTLQIESDGDIFAKHYSDVTVAVETPAAPDSELSPKAQQVLAHWQAQYTETSRGLKTWQLATGEWINESDIDELVAAGLVDSTPRTSLVGPLQVLNAKGLAYVVVSTIAAVAITDDSAADNTLGEPKREITQPSASEPVLSVATYDALLYIYNVERGLISVHACDSLTRAGLITPICMQGSQWLVKSNDAGREYVEKYLLAKEAQPVSGWLADALQSVNVTSEAAANDEYLPPTVEDNDDLPFSDLGEDDTPNWTSIDGDIIDSQRERIHELEAQNWQRNETIASLEARVRKLESIIQSANSLAYQLRSSLYPIVDSNSLAILCDIEDLTRKEAIS